VRDPGEELGEEFVRELAGREGLSVHVLRMIGVGARRCQSTFVRSPSAGTYTGEET
jgi:hypothetical protein